MEGRSYTHDKDWRLIMNDIHQYPLISIMILVYEVEKYVKKCIESVINQSYENMEIIIICRDSEDRCMQICKDYAMSDSRIVVIEQIEKGRGSARNIGLDNANGDYYVFLDGDDWMDINFVKIMYENLIHNNVDIKRGSRYEKI